MKKELSKKAYKIVGNDGFTTIFIPTCKRVEQEYENGDKGEQLWEQIYDDGLLCGNWWTLNEIMRTGNAVEIPNPRQGNEELVRILKDLHETTESQMVEMQCKQMDEEEEKYLSYLKGQGDLLRIIIKNIK